MVVISPKLWRSKAAAQVWSSAASELAGHSVADFTDLAATASVPCRLSCSKTWPGTVWSTAVSLRSQTTKHMRKYLRTPKYMGNSILQISSEYHSSSIIFLFFLLPPRFWRPNRLQPRGPCSLWARNLGLSQAIAHDAPSSLPTQKEQPFGKQHIKSNSKQKNITQDETHEPECRHVCWGTETILSSHISSEPVLRTQQIWKHVLNIIKTETPMSGPSHSQKLLLPSLWTKDRCGSMRVIPGSQRMQF